MKNTFPVIIELFANKFLLYIVNNHQCNLFIMFSFSNNLFTVSGNNNTMSYKNGIGNKNIHSKLLVIDIYCYIRESCFWLEGFKSCINLGMVSL